MAEVTIAGIGHMALEVTHEILSRHVLEGDFSYFVLSCSENFSHCIFSLPDGSELLLCVCNACMCVCVSILGVHAHLHAHVCA